MAQFSTKPDHVYTVANLERRYEQALDTLRRTAHDPEIPISVGELLEFFHDCVLPIPSNFCPPGWIIDTLASREGKLIAADYWDEMGASQRADSLRDNVSCNEYCAEELQYAIEEWKLGNPEDPSTESILTLILREHIESRILKIPYGVHFLRSNSA